eukprot:CAMPEP_0197860732 /NCGR_PEP_ID=MMETSP1438-20131217/36341_1 /TAXON_ID=1461541 /ORGANISM="Pterosperma sp., Strain CCMP1384" /LENGTH=55 /DNA_ID=CAMNT_0043477711 /DNA_START=67 /DNA_END=231 /DNA_ORIENTATION=+
MIVLVDDPHPLVRSITCWSLSRFSCSMVEAAHSPEGVEPGTPEAEAKKQQGQLQL